MRGRLRNLLVGAVVLVVGAAGLLLPVSVWDGGGSIGCGNGIALDQARVHAASSAPAAEPPSGAQANPRPDYVAECESAISARRHWAIPLVIVGAIGVLIGVFYRGSGRRRT